jgi:hypothetical protein
MNIDLDELRHRIRSDHRFKKRLRMLVLMGGVAVLIIAVVAVIGVVWFSSAVIGFVFSHAPALYEMAFNTVRDVAGSYMRDDLTAALGPLAGGTNVNEMKGLITQYVDQLSSNPAVDFQSFQKFSTTVKSALLDGQITNAELELAKQYLLEK